MEIVENNADIIDTSEKRQQALETVRSLFGVLDSKELFGLMSQIEREAKIHIASTSDKPKLSKAFGFTAYDIQINQACLPIESIQQAAQYHNEDFQMIKQERLHSSTKWRYNPDMVLLFADFFSGTGQALETDSLKYAVKGSTTLNSGLTRVYKHQQHEKEIRRLKERADQQELELSKLKAEMVLNKLSIEHIQDVSGWDITPKEKARALRDKGYTHGQVAEILGVSKSTVKRYCKD